MDELIAFLVISGPNFYDEYTKEYDILMSIDDYHAYTMLEYALEMEGYEIFLDMNIDAWIVKRIET